MLTWDSDLGVPTHDLLPAFHGRDHKAYWVEGDGHPNRAGHELIATGMHAVLALLLNGQE